MACKICQRNFAEDRVEKHEEICKKTQEKDKKRKAFDMTKKRVAGTDAAKFVKSASQLKAKEAKVSSNSSVLTMIFIELLLQRSKAKV